MDFVLILSSYGSNVAYVFRNVNDKSLVNSYLNDNNYSFVCAFRFLRNSSKVFDGNSLLPYFVDFLVNAFNIKDFKYF